MDKSKVLLTGANGMLGGKIVKLLVRDTDYDIIAMASSKEKIDEMLVREKIQNTDRVQFLSNQEFLSGERNPQNVYGAVHLAFSRSVRPSSDIAASIDFSGAVFKQLAKMGADRVINLSTQAVYGLTSSIRREDMTVSPETVYAMAKYAAEKILETNFQETKAKNYTNLRLDLVIQSQKLIPALCAQAKNGMIQLRGGEQQYSFIDADDAAAAVVAMLQSPGGWEKVYNVGWNRRRYTLLQLAEMIADTAEQRGCPRPDIKLDRQDIKLWYGMDCEKFMAHTGWKPDFDIHRMIEKIME